MQERIGSQSNSMVRLSCFLLGTYGYKVPHRNLSTNIDLVFDEIIPVAFEQYRANFSTDGTDFLKDLVSAMESGYDNHTVLSHIWIENGKPVKPDEKYLFFMHYPATLLPEVVWWNGNIVCGNLNKFIEKSLKKLEYFKQFNKS